MPRIIRVGRPTIRFALLIGAIVVATAAVGSIAGPSALLAQQAPAAPATDPTSVEILVWQSVAHADTAAMYQGYLERYGENGQFAFIAHQRILELSKAPPATGTAASATPPVTTTAPAALSSADAAPVTDCDRLAASVLQAKKLPDVVGRDTDLIDPALALPACAAAVAANPGESRFLVELGRVQTRAKNYIEGNALFERAIAAGNIDAPNNLGASYYLGHGVPQDYARAFALFTKGVDLGDPAAMVSLGAMYANGLFVQKDPAKSQVLYARSVDAGNYAALRNLGILYLNGEGVPKNDKRAVDYFEQAASHGDTFAMKMLADMYQHGWGLPKNMALSREWNEKAGRARP